MSRAERRSRLDTHNDLHVLFSRSMLNAAHKYNIYIYETTKTFLNFKENNV